MQVQPPPTSPPTRWIWPFELLEQIGEGGMGVVYRARYVVNDRQVALKMVPSDVTDKTVLARFEREVEVLKTLKHPNIVRCFGGSCEDKRRFYAMELVEGGTLEDQLQEKKKLPWEQVVFYALQMCSALECSHAKGVVHRDIKPGNFLLTPSGQLKLADFGLASVEAARKITAAGKTAGTFLYMAPEQIRGHEVTPRTDLYALGCVLYELVTGVPPFVGETAAATLHMHCHNTPSRPTELTFACPVSLENIILELLNKDPAQRPASATVLAKKLRGVNQKITIVEKRKETILGKVPMDVQLPPPAQVIKPQSGSPAWVTIILAVALCASLLMNLKNRPTATEIKSEKLWINAVNNPLPEVRVQAASALGEISIHSPESVSALMDGLNDAEPAVRLAMVNGLGKSGYNGKPAIATLVKVHKHDTDASIRDAAEKSLVLIKAAKYNSFPWLGTFIATLLLAGTTLGVWYWFKNTQSNNPSHSHAVI